MHEYAHNHLNTCDITSAVRARSKYGLLLVPLLAPNTVFFTIRTEEECKFAPVLVGMFLIGPSGTPSKQDVSTGNDLWTS